MNLDAEIKELTDLRDSLPSSEEEIKAIIRKDIKNNPEGYADLIKREGEEAVVNDIYLDYSERLNSAREKISSTRESIQVMQRKYSHLLV